jgi:hypothetical protein
MIKLPKLTTAQVDQVNIGLMIISLVLAFVLPFEVFLFSYAVLGPLHYLTEISWLHQKNYFVPKVKKLTLWIFPILALILTTVLVWDDVEELVRKWLHLQPLKVRTFEDIWNTNIIFFLFGVSFVFILLPKVWMKIAGVAIVTIFALSLNLGKTCITCTSNRTQQPIELCDYTEKQAVSFISNKCADTNKDGMISPNVDFKEDQKFAATAMFFTAYLPTLIHVYIFTMLFMLFGALKSKSKTGLISVGVLIVCGLMPFLWDPPFLHYKITEGAKLSYDNSFFSLNKIIFRNFSTLAATPENVYGSSFGIMLTRFIAFAYTYHYLNWFSKTSIIQWHKLPMVNLIVVLVLWVTAVVLYYVEYKTGLTMLLLLSFLHVFLEFPLNFTTFVGIFKSLFGKKPASAGIKN